MLKTYFKTAIRSLWKNKFYSAINIGGLAVGLATGIMLLLWVQHELSYEKFHNDYKQIYRLSTHFNSDGEDHTWSGVPGPLAIFAKSIPAIQAVVRTQTEFDQVLSDKEKKKVFDGNQVTFVDSTFFSLFNFPLLQGNQASLFSNNNSVVITKDLAQKLFGLNEALGNTVVFYDNLFTVTGVLEDFPENTSIRFDAIFPMGLLAQNFTANGGNGDWKTIDSDLGSFAFTTFVKLKPGANPERTAQAFTSNYKKTRNGDSNATFKLQNLGDIHLVSANGNNLALRMVQVFMLVVILLLVIASINYVNLSTARCLTRAREVSIRKIIGAQKGQLFLQFFIETIILFCFATALAFVLIYLLMPLYNNLSGKRLSFSLSDINVWLTALIAIAGTLIASAIYPALLLSSFNPIESLKGKITTGLGIVSFRKVLVIFQFTTSVILLVCTLTMSRQIKYIKSKDIGYDKNYVFSVPLTNSVVDHLGALKSELKKQPGILSVSACDAYDLSNVGNATGDIEWEGKPSNSNMIMTTVSADADFIPTMKMKFIEGLNFTGTPADSNYYILNETAVKSMGLKPPYVAQQISLHNHKGAILGVVKDFNFQSLKDKITPLLFYTCREYKNILYVRTTDGNAQQALASVKKQYKTYASGVPFKYNFLDKNFEDHYQSEQRAGALFNVFACIAIFISCLGLFGLVTYTAQVKTKEIGIRKVLGASVAAIVKLISKDFIKLIIISIIMATPIALFAMSKWLQEFAYRVDISWWVFVVAGGIAVLIAILTLSFQAVKAALANPVKSLRTE